MMHMAAAAREAKHRTRVDVTAVLRALVSQRCTFARRAAEPNRVTYLPITACVYESATNLTRPRIASMTAIKSLSRPQHPLFTSSHRTFALRARPLQLNFRSRSLHQIQHDGKRGRAKDGGWTADAPLLSCRLRGSYAMSS
jgi:hypothetical protein